jgi:hypothetical protein
MTLFSLTEFQTIALAAATAFFLMGVLMGALGVFKGSKISHLFGWATVSLVPGALLFGWSVLSYPLLGASFWLYGGFLGGLARRLAQAVERR